MIYGLRSSCKPNIYVSGADEDFLKGTSHRLGVLWFNSFNPFMVDVFSYPYQLDESTSNFRVAAQYFTFLFKCKKKLL